VRLAFTEEQELSRRVLRELLDEACTPEHVRAAWSNTSGRVPSLWTRLAELGIVGLTAPEPYGGQGLSELDLVLLLEESGRAALPEPLLETTAVGIPLLAALCDDPRAAALLPRVAGGDAIVGVALESIPYVAFADVAEAIVVQRADEAHWVEAGRGQLVRQLSVDRSRQLFELAFRADDGTRIARGAAVTQAFAQAFDRGALAAAAQLVGLGGRLIEIATEHVKTRQQFGRPIGSFQAVKHQLVDAYLGLAFARPLVHRAAHSMAHLDPERAAHVSAAKAFASDAASRAARVALQLHGAIGYSYEHDLHLWMKRVWALAATWGDAAFHRRRVADAIIGDS
jgi:alkylation response protein AidB-like acyl-CoA dehydrogenase